MIATQPTGQKDRRLWGRECLSTETVDELRPDQPRSQGLSSLPPSNDDQKGREERPCEQGCVLMGHVTRMQTLPYLYQNAFIFASKNVV